LYEKVLGFKDLEDFMVNFWEAWALSKGKSAGAPVSTSLPLREREREREGERERGRGRKAYPCSFMLLPFPFGHTTHLLTMQQTPRTC
jgi:hypothetical protein